MPPKAVKMKKELASTPLVFPTSNVMLNAPRPDPREPLSILAINVNGIRSALSKGLRKFLYERNPDIICFSETKLGLSAFSAFMEKEGTPVPDTDTYSVLNGYRHIFCCSTAKQGYASTAVFIKSDIPVLGFSTSMGQKEFDTEGRFIQVSFTSFELIHVYVPNSGRGSNGKSFTAKNKPANLPARIRYETAIADYIGKLLSENKQVIYCGDLNVAHEEIDLYNPKSNHFSPGFTDEERAEFSNLLKRYSLVDTFRSMHPTKIKYSWFSNFGSARAKKNGWRIDYFVTTQAIFERLNEVDILDEYDDYSDHVPIVMTLKPSSPNGLDQEGATLETK